MLDYKSTFVWIRLTSTARIHGKPFRSESTVKLIHKVLDHAIKQTNNIIHIKNITISSDL